MINKAIVAVLGGLLILGTAACDPAGTDSPTPTPTPTPTAKPTASPTPGQAPTTPPPDGFVWSHDARFGFTAAVPKDWPVKQVTEADGSGITVERDADTSLKFLAANVDSGDPTSLCDVRAAAYQSAGFTVTDSGKTPTGCYFVGVAPTGTGMQWQMWIGAGSMNMMIATYRASDTAVVSVVTTSRQAFVAGDLAAAH